MYSAKVDAAYVFEYSATNNSALTANTVSKMLPLLALWNLVFFGPKGDRRWSAGIRPMKFESVERADTNLGE